MKGFLGFLGTTPPTLKLKPTSKTEEGFHTNLTRFNSQDMMVLLIPHVVEIFYLYTAQLFGWYVVWYIAVRKHRDAYHGGTHHFCPSAYRTSRQHNFVPLSRLT